MFEKLYTNKKKKKKKKNNNNNNNNNNSKKKKNNNNNNNNNNNDNNTKITFKCEFPIERCKLNIYLRFNNNKIYTRAIYIYPPPSSDLSCCPF